MDMEKVTWKYLAQSRTVSIANTWFADAYVLISLSGIGQLFCTRPNFGIVIPSRNLIVG